eukprot:2482213-Amphidinium_carterae.1
MSPDTLAVVVFHYVIVLPQRSLCTPYARVYSHTLCDLRRNLLCFFMLSCLYPQPLLTNEHWHRDKDLLRKFNFLLRKKHKRFRLDNLVLARRAHPYVSEVT